ncbi:fumarylacetoacetate hydrolase family protein [Bacillus suaedaesalsae]|uniref:Fumarylacetoacetate hydrolase family protein n=1 Tax=Bacillus suaedaesalsae TaxID=2810349 RepID=A0ABS2DLR9_9BACI|nr:fumarylacetoacetate hydrolase family protein [Bacillus suaedaesalsae]
MKFITFQKPSGEVAGGWIHDDYAIDMQEASNGKLPSKMLELIENYDEYKDLVDSLSKALPSTGVYQLDRVILKAPLERPTSVRDFYAFLDHVRTARGRRGLDVVPEWYEIPVFYFSNHLAIKGPNQEIEKPQATQRLDYELEVACIIGKEGKNIKVKDAHSYIFGFCILNDWSARDLQAQEVKVGLGPAKGKDFATSLGPWLVTKDELEQYRDGDNYNLEMTATVNGKLLSKGNFKDIYYSFNEMIERASKGVSLYPGDVIGSGTVGTGCLLELGQEVHRWLDSGDEVELNVTGLGALKNTIINEKAGEC